jgi:hypothetical protein
MCDEYKSNYKGTYLTQSRILLPFNAIIFDKKVLIALDGRSGGIASSNLLTGMAMDGQIFWVDLEEFENFKTNIVDKNVNWIVINRLGEKVTLPGFWITSKTS